MPGASYVIKYGTTLHKKVLDYINVRYRKSSQDMSALHENWQNAEKQFLAYVPSTEVTAAREALRAGGKPQYTTISIPYSYAILMTMHTYWCSVFLSRSPVWQFSARHAETPENVQAVEALMDYQLLVGKQLVPLYMWLMDVGKYGHGVLGCYWEEEEISIAAVEEQPELFMGVLPIPGKTRKVKTTKRVRGYTGNRLYNVRPYHWYPDTRLPLHRFQEGEFCGRYVEIGWNQIVKRAERGDYFNLDALRNKRKGTPLDTFSNGTNQPFPTTGDFIADPKDSGYVPAVEMEIELIPKDWGLGASTYPEKWMFTVLKDMSLIFGARPKGELHNQYGFSMMALEPEAYALASRGEMEILKPLQEVMDWLINTHFYNVRKVLNDTVIVDPSRVMMKDVLNPMPGGVWRLAPGAYGSDTRLVASQLEIRDVTQLHMQDADRVAMMMQRVSGATDQIMGMMMQGGRRTAQESRTSAGFGMNRLKNQTEFFSALGWAPLAQMMLQNTQQYYDLTQEFKIAGGLMRSGLTNRVRVTPEDIQGFYDFSPIDGTLPVDRFQQVQMWTSMLKEMATISPQLLMGYDIGGIFEWVGQLAGLKDMSQFRIQVNIQSDQQLMEMVRTGKIVSLEDARRLLAGTGAGPSAGNQGGGGGPPEGGPGIPQPTQLPGMGTVG